MDAISSLFGFRSSRTQTVPGPTTVAPLGPPPALPPSRPASTPARVTQPLPEPDQKPGVLVPFPRSEPVVAVPAFQLRLPTSTPLAPPPPAPPLPLPLAIPRPATPRAPRPRKGTTAVAGAGDSATVVLVPAESPEDRAARTFQELERQKAVHAANEVTKIVWGVTRLFFCSSGHEKDFIESGNTLFQCIAAHSAGDQDSIDLALKTYIESAARDGANLNSTLGERAVQPIYSFSPTSEVGFVPTLGTVRLPTSSGVAPVTPLFYSRRKQDMKLMFDSRRVMSDFRTACDQASHMEVDPVTGDDVYYGPTHNGDITFRTPGISTHCRTTGDEAKVLIDRMHATPPEGEAGAFKIKVVRSWSRASTLLHVTDAIAQEIPGLHKYYSVYNAMEAKVFKVRLTATTAALEKFEKTGSHFFDRVKYYGWTFYGHDLVAALNGATECTISDGITMADVKEAMNKGVNFSSPGGAGCNRLTIKAKVVIKGFSNIAGAVPQDVPCDVILSVVETTPFDATRGLITATAIFFITVMPEIAEVTQYSHTGASFTIGDYSSRIKRPPLVRIIGRASDRLLNKAKEEVISSEMMKGSAWSSLDISVEEIEDCKFSIFRAAAEFADAALMMRKDPSPGKVATKNIVAAVITAIATLSKTLGGLDDGIRLSSERIRTVLTEKLIPSVGPGGSIWHPTSSDGTLNNFTLDHLLIRCFLCFTCSYSSPLDGSSLFVHNQWRAATTRVPACIFPRGVLWYGVAPHFVSMMTKECGTGHDHSALFDMKGSLFIGKGVHVTASDYSQFHFGVVCCSKVGPVAIPSDQVVRGRLYTIDPQGIYYSHDLQIANAAEYMVNRAKLNEEQGLDQSGAILCYTNSYAIVVSYSEACGVVVYVHSSVRTSHVSPTYHASRAVTISEASSIREHYVRLGRQGAFGYVLGLLGSWPHLEGHLYDTLTPSEEEVSSQKAEELFSSAGPSVTAAMGIVGRRM